MGKNCFVSIAKNDIHNMAVCCCGWRGKRHPAGAHGEQLATNEGREHYGLKPVASMSRVAARPVYSFEIEAEARKHGR